MGHMGNVAYPHSRSTWQGNEAHGQCGTWEIGHISIRDRAMGTWLIRHMADRVHGQMADRAHGQWGTLVQ